ncbi:MAG: phage late control D family protein [Anaerolineae bacterium]|nr:phage late control D family protein [Anaerolineae bacterium]
MPGSTIPDFNIRINGANLPPEARSDIRAVTVHEDLDALSMFTVELFNWRTEGQNQRSTWADAALFGIGNEVEIWLGYVDDLQKVMLAEITSLEATYSTGDEEEDVLIVRGYDHRHRLTRGRKTRTFTQIKDSAIASQVATGAGLRAQVKDSKVSLPYVVQSNQTDWEFLQSRAARIGYEVFVREKVLYFRPPQNTSQATLRLELDTHISEFTPRLSSLAQVGEVTVRGWDVKQKQVIVGKAGAGQEASLMGGRSSGPRTANRAFGKPASPASANP